MGSLMAGAHEFMHNSRCVHHPQMSRQQIMGRMCKRMMLTVLDVTVPVYFEGGVVRFKDGCQFGAVNGRILKLR